MTLETPYMLPGVPPAAAGSTADVTVLWEGRDGCRSGWKTLEPSTQPHAPEVGTTADGETCLAWREGSEGMLWIVAADGSCVRLYCAEHHFVHAAAMTVGLILGVVLQRRGVLCLHGAAVSWKGRSLAVLGASGSGKSTLSAALVARGATLLADDLVAVTQAAGAPAVERGCLGIRLLPASLEQGIVPAGRNVGKAIHHGKHLWDLSAEAELGERACPLEGIWVLRPAPQDSGAFAMAALAPMDAMRQLVSNWYPPSLFRLMEPAAFSRMRELACDVPVRAVTYGHRWSHLSALAETLLA
ncbi:HPr kinase/phosphorylase [Pigmentiphaga humi]|uniref:HPr kinase/phosphorylase n=1 Tax=Pigmentiphaga humi TaxID=2478468 RepID=UPI000F549F1B|nr:hypothetical protein [Pigmentiphaga humi]